MIPLNTTTERTKSEIRPTKKKVVQEQYKNPENTNYHHKHKSTTENMQSKDIPENDSSQWDYRISKSSPQFQVLHFPTI